MPASTPCRDCRGAAFLGAQCTWPCTAVTTSLAPTHKQRISAGRHLTGLLAVLALLIAMWQFGQATYIHAKAWLAQRLIADAWQHALDTGETTPPWPWADTWPVARLRVSTLGVDQFVLAGADDRSIAFGPGLVHGTAAPGGHGNSVLGGHRDTHFSFLRDLRDGDLIEMQATDGHWHTYRVGALAVVDKRDLWVLEQHGPDRLSLVTCYPFDALSAGGDARYLVVAERVTVGRPRPAAAIMETPRAHHVTLARAEDG